MKRPLSGAAFSFSSAIIHIVDQVEATKPLSGFFF
jgi:hypothetical protein